MGPLASTETERTELKTILTSYVADLQVEIAGTNSSPLREALKRREVLLQKLIHVLE